METFFRRHRLALLLLFFTAVCLPLLLHKKETKYTFDETSFHLPAIQQIRGHWPRLDLNADSLSATAPGYQYLLAGISLFTGPDKITLRLVNLGLSLSVLLVLWFAWPRGTDDALRLAALMPLAACNFFVKSASYIVTDNAALLAVAGSLCLSLLGRTPGALPGAGVIAALAVFCRQINLWLEAPLLLRLLRTTRPIHWWPALLPLAVLGWLVHAWGGLVPPAWTSHHRGGLVFAAGAYQFALCAILGVFYYAAVAPADWRQNLLNRWTVSGGLIGLLVTLAGNTVPSYEAGRWGGYLWTVAEYAPLIGQTSLVFLITAPLGGAMLGLLTQHLWRVVGAQSAVPWLITVLSFMATGLTNRQVFQRYYEPPLLVLLLIWLVLLTANNQSPLRLKILYLLAGLELGVTALTAYGITFFRL